MQGERAAVVGVEGEQILRPAHHRRADTLLDDEVVQAREVGLETGPVATVLPQILEIGGEALGEPQIAPLRDRHGVAEPLVGELVHDGQLIDAATLEGRHRLRLERVEELRVVDHDRPVAVERVGADQLLDEVEHGRSLGAVPLGFPSACFR